MSEIDDLLRGLKKYGNAGRDCAISAEDALTLAAALEAAREDGWKPIETAPRDGTTVVVYFKGHGPMTVAWEDPWGDGPEGAIWCVTDHKHGPYPVRGYRTGDDTHWRPLPAPPAIDQARGKGVAE